MKQIVLSGGKSKGPVAVVDDVDADLAILTRMMNHAGYAARSKHIRKAVNKYSSHPVFLHRVIAERMFGPIKWESGVIVDHINRDRRDNRRSNIRLSSRLLNSKNASIYRNNQSGYKGVVYERARGRYRANIRSENTEICIGRFTEPEVAAWMRDQWAIELHGEYASLNFEYV